MDPRLTINIVPTSRLICAPQTAELARRYLAAGDPLNAVAILANAVAGLIESDGRNVPDGVLATPGSTGDFRYDAVLATAFPYAANLCWVEPPAWNQITPLERT
jgi:hypothetical protein